VWQKCHRQPALVLSPAEMSFLGDVRGKHVCVLGSGDNEVVFALAGMGAAVTSVDISEKQLEIAEQRAGVLGLDVSFLRADVVDLAVIPDDAFDVVYTGGHVSVWISDIAKYYSEAVRVLRAEGLLIVNEYHPIRRMWHESEGPTPRHRYFDLGPYEYLTENGLTHVEFHWTTADHIQAVVDAGCTLVKVHEHGERKEEEEYAAAVPSTLPEYLMIVGRKRTSNETPTTPTLLARR
jgi:ubiquinone/menaquinone biosynthesis C-methylase UbiE